MMTYSNSASMQVEVTAYAILVFNEISSRGVSGCQVSNHLKESLLFSLSIEKRDILIILHGFGSLKGTRRCTHINTVTLYPKWKKKRLFGRNYTIHQETRWRSVSTACGNVKKLNIKQGTLERTSLQIF